MSLVQDSSQSQSSNNLRDKFLALKKIFRRKFLVVRTVFADVQSFLDVCRLKLQFQFVGNQLLLYKGLQWDPDNGIVNGPCNLIDAPIYAYPLIFYSCITIYCLSGGRQSGLLVFNL